MQIWDGEWNKDLFLYVFLNIELFIHFLILIILEIIFKECNEQHAQKYRHKKIDKYYIIATILSSIETYFNRTKQEKDVKRRTLDFL